MSIARIPLITDLEEGSVILGHYYTNESEVVPGEMADWALNWDYENAWTKGQDMEIAAKAMDQFLKDWDEGGGHTNGYYNYTQ